MSSDDGRLWLAGASLLGAAMLASRRGSRLKTGLGPAYESWASRYHVDFAEVRSVNVIPMLLLAVKQRKILILNGSGRSMVARRIPTILGPPSAEVQQAIIDEAKAVNLYDRSIYDPSTTLTRPFRAPHHTSTFSGLQRELKLAYGGVLYLDEIDEFKRADIETLIKSFFVVPMDRRPILIFGVGAGADAGRLDKVLRFLQGTGLPSESFGIPGDGVAWPSSLELEGRLRSLRSGSALKTVLDPLPYEEPNWVPFGRSAALPSKEEWTLSTGDMYRVSRDESQAKYTQNAWTLAYFPAGERLGTVISSTAYRDGHHHSWHAKESAVLHHRDMIDQLRAKRSLLKDDEG